MPTIVGIRKKHVADRLDAMLKKKDFIFDGVQMTKPTHILEFIENSNDYDFERYRWGKQEFRMVASKQYMHRSGALFVRLIPDTRGLLILAAIENQRNASRENKFREIARNLVLEIQKEINESETIKPTTVEEKTENESVTVEQMTEEKAEDIEPIAVEGTENDEPTVEETEKLEHRESQKNAKAESHVVEQNEKVEAKMEIARKKVESEKVGENKKVEQMPLVLGVEVNETNKRIEPGMDQQDDAIAPTALDQIIEPKPTKVHEPEPVSEA